MAPAGTRWALLALMAVALAPAPAHALRFTLGLGTSFTPLAIAGEGEDAPNALRFGLMPILEVEPSRYFSFGAHAPFTLLRLGEANDTSSGAESVFGLQASARYPIDRADAPEELLLYLTGRLGYGTLDARAGIFGGGAAGVAATSLGRGIGLYGELSVGYLGIAGDAPGEGERPARSRVLFGLSVGILFRLGGESWTVDRTRSG